jgi:hypothetical protein
MEHDLVTTCILLIKDMLSITLTIEHNLVLKDRHTLKICQSCL